MDKWIMYIVSLLLGMLMFYILKDVCGCGNIVEGGFIDTVEEDLGFGSSPTCPDILYNDRYCLKKCIDTDTAFSTPSNYKNPPCLCKYEGNLLTYYDVAKTGLNNPKPLLTAPRACEWREWVNAEQWQGQEDAVTATH
jgi:hypothetical protein